MTNKHRGEVELDIDGKTLQLKLTLNAFAELQEAFDGAPLMEILGRLDQMDVKVLIHLLYLAAGKAIPLKKIGDMDICIQEVTTKLGECITLALAGPNPKK